MISIVLNGEPKEIVEGKSIMDLVDSLNLPAERLAVEHNLKIIKRAHWNDLFSQTLCWQDGSVRLLAYEFQSADFLGR